jgi:hypothetical protein
LCIAPTAEKNEREDYSMASQKRTIDGVEELESLIKPKSNTSIHGAITSLSPVKKGQNSLFFDGRIADETSRVRIVGVNLCAVAEETQQVV